ncbi:MAG: TetR/AcrR family transcriptional regulator [Actinomyces sp.]|jgi:AcrR family transcriptional regulator|nr:TetR/AcrR family transcriptional regulator [Actinomyces sp.]MCI1642494.1 TetR/AcrR family transcriptional regulator [Actinomyces sp.]MCI1662736.1 TetR/AcrR family transcriptional regulator [Actinomyces sp.]MCI1691647.1 TetR/AcrR family transcriptional regulator [Actinomyces sp.]
MPAEHRTRGSYSAGQATRESILDAAMRLIAESGYHGFSLRDVGREVGISHPAVIYHFPSKEALLLAVIHRFEQQMGLVGVEIDEGGAGLVERGVIPGDLGALSLQLMRLAKNPEAATLMMSVDSALAVESACPSHPAHAHYVSRLRALRAFLVDQLGVLADHGRCRSDLRADALADCLIRTWYGLAVHTRYLADTDAGRYPISTFLATSARLLALTPETVLLAAASVPEDLGDIFARSMRMYTGMADA